MYYDNLQETELENSTKIDETDMHIIRIFHEEGRTSNKEIAEEVMELQHVESVTMITGRFDLVIEVFIQPHSLLDFLTNMLPSVDGIASTETHMTIRTFNKWI